MHILIGLITAIGGLLWALYRLQQSGVNLNDFNPFYWVRRKRWQKRYHTKPLHTLESPMEAAACLLVGIAKLEGEISREQKSEIIALFEREFKIDSHSAQDLFAGSSYLLSSTHDVSAEVKNILQPCLDKFTDETTDSLVDMLEKVASLEHQASADQQSLIESVREIFHQQKNSPSKWQ